MKFVHKTHKGNVRETNEDYYYVPSEDGSLFVLADGMGGHLAGETASRLAVEVVVKEIEKLNFKTEEELVLGMQNAVTKANEAVYQKSLDEINFRGMGTTLSLGYVYNKKFYYTNVGDSRIYRIKDDIKQITRDDSFVNYLVELGEITPEEAKMHPKKNVITRAIGTAEKVIPEIKSFELTNEKILICSDGLTNMVSDEEILQVIAKEDFNYTAELLVDKALAAGGIDNITLIIINIE